MDDYIKRKDAEMSHCSECSWNGCCLCPCEDVKAILAIPAADAVKRPRWISVTERLPKESGEYLVYICIDDTEPFYGIVPFDADVPAFGRWEEHYDPVTYGWAGSDFVEIRDVTHWMPLPEPPEEAES